ncbi:7-carboxy-7-deazaguanine synthase [Azospirillum sp. B506]|uniref:7-carboxy-7-deazaguanine synthase n=1 Tax=Azospirillum sp. B506 TaxID=137721 RepID=UPI00034DDEE1|nr:7-carboxy-7-deazaguanine synthase [Azospirillum sp. B506]
MSYSIKELFYTLQGEGAQAGRPAVFCRFSGCNLWSGLERDRSTARCRFCDTDFVGMDGPGGGRYPDAPTLAAAVAALWPADSGGKPLVVCTGGEPLLQLDGPLIEALHAQGFAVAVESNGTQPAPAGLDWLCVSPKAGAPLVTVRGDELKLVYPQDGLDPAGFLNLDFRHFILQPKDDGERAANLRLTVAYCLDHPRWRLGLQMHKAIGLP